MSYPLGLQEWQEWVCIPGMGRVHATHELPTYSCMQGMHAVILQIVPCQE
jgi:hypothetical protein